MKTLEKKYNEIYAIIEFYRKRKCCECDIIYNNKDDVFELSLNYKSKYYIYNILDIYFDLLNIKTLLKCDVNFNIVFVNKIIYKFDKDNVNEMRKKFITTFQEDICSKTNDEINTMFIKFIEEKYSLLFTNTIFYENSNIVISFYEKINFNQFVINENLDKVQSVKQIDITIVKNKQMEGVNDFLKKFKFVEKVNFHNEVIECYEDDDDDENYNKIKKTTVVSSIKLNSDKINIGVINFKNSAINNISIEDIKVKNIIITNSPKVSYIKKVTIKINSVNKIYLDRIINCSIDSEKVNKLYICNEDENDVKSELNLNMNNINTFNIKYNRILSKDLNLLKEIDVKYLKVTSENYMTNHICSISNLNKFFGKEILDNLNIKNKILINKVNFLYLIRSIKENSNEILQVDDNNNVFIIDSVEKYCYYNKNLLNNKKLKVLLIYNMSIDNIIINAKVVLIIDSTIDEVINSKINNNNIGICDSIIKKITGCSKINNLYYWMNHNINSDIIVENNIRYCNLYMNNNKFTHNGYIYQLSLYDYDNDIPLIYCHKYIKTNVMYRFFNMHNSPFFLESNYIKLFNFRNSGEKQFIAVDNYNDVKIYNYNTQQRKSFVEFNESFKIAKEKNDLLKLCKCHDNKQNKKNNKL